MRRILVYIAVGLLRLVNCLFKPLSLRQKVAIISRQSDTPTLDIQLLDDYLRAQGMETVVLTKTLQKSLRGAISYCGQMLVQMYHIATSKVVVLDGYCILVSVLPKKKGQKVVQMWHALGAIKKFGWQNTDNPDGHGRAFSEAMKMHRNYDYILTPSHVTGKFFAEAFRATEDKLVYLGLPRIDFIRENDEKTRRRMEIRYPKITKKTNVLYVPTFRKNAALELTKLVEGFDFGQFNLIIKKHFLDRGDYTWAERAGAIVDTVFTSLEWLRICPKVVTDYSAISFEAAVLDREVYIYQPDATDYAENVGLNVDLTQEAIGAYVCRTEEALFDKLAEPYDVSAIKAFREKYLEIELDGCTQKLGDFVGSLLAE